MNCLVFFENAMDYVEANEAINYIYELRTRSHRTWSSTLVFATIIISLGTSVPYGFHLGVINAPAYHIRSWSNETLYERYNFILSYDQLEIVWATIVSIFLLGGAIGSLCGGWIANKYGRRIPFLVTCLLYLGGAAFFLKTRSSQSVEMLILGRFIVGIASGIGTSTAPMYLAELAPTNLRGPFGAFFSLGITIGILLGQVCSLQQVYGNEEQWPYALSIFGVIIAIALLFYSWLPESPKYLYVISGNKSKARSELKKLRGLNLKLVYEEMLQMDNEVNTQCTSDSVFSVLTNPTLLLPIVLVCSIQAGQQLSGINCVFYYSVSLYESVGVSLSTAELINLGGGVINILADCAGPIIIANVNRRPAIILSSVFSGIFLIIMSFSLEFSTSMSWLQTISVIAFYGFVTAFSLSLGPIAHFIASELFESYSRSSAMALGSLSGWMFNFITGLTFPMIQLVWGSYVLLPYAFCCFVLAVLLKYYLPETRNREPSELTPLINRGFKSRPLSKLSENGIYEINGTTLTISNGNGRMNGINGEHERNFNLYTEVRDLTKQ